ncbi:hypothetical protein DPMN_087953 [Dreissena polymorpha]|uniref:Uncharacterized protein n=1 Tax=Dreissena polymorpha TaxID=45954 RepID=A0A9D4QWV6_DREPO|nr:hypothetical protein DPMN_087953 [Dreissena polymorpha]
MCIECRARRFSVGPVAGRSDGTGGTIPRTKRTPIGVEHFSPGPIGCTSIGRIERMRRGPFRWYRRNDSTDLTHSHRSRTLFYRTYRVRITRMHRAGVIRAILMLPAERVFRPYAFPSNSNTFLPDLTGAHRSDASSECDAGRSDGTCATISWTLRIPFGVEDFSHVPIV